MLSADFKNWSYVINQFATFNPKLFGLFLPTHANYLTIGASQLGGLDYWSLLTIALLGSTFTPRFLPQSELIEPVLSQAAQLYG